MDMFDPKFEATSRVLVTAAHLGDIDGYTCVYSDADTDVGIYLKDGYIANAPLVGERVQYLGSFGYVREVHNGEIAVECDDTQYIVPGVSGSPVYYEGVPIGFISGWNGHGLLRVVLY